MEGESSARFTLRGSNEVNPTAYQVSRLGTLKYHRRPKAPPIALGPCADMTATFLAFDYRRLYHFVLAKPPNEN